jgi:hypothetical protein
VIPTREAIRLGLVPRADQGEETDFATEGPPSDWIVQQCRHGNASQGGPEPGSLHCRAIIAIAEGLLAPGAYSDEELRATLKR